MSNREEFSTMKEARESAMPSQHRSRFSRRSMIVAGIAAALIVIGLAIGLGVGLGLRNDNNDDYSGDDTPIPTLPPTANGTIWQPAVNSTWQIVLEEPIQISSENKTTDPDVEIFDIDLFSNSNETIRLLKGLDKKVVCYFSAGSYEPYRPDSSQFQQSVLGKTLDGWDVEKWIDIRSDNVRNIMIERIRLAKEKGCDAVDPDNVDAYNNDNGLDLTQEDTIDFVQFLANVTSSHGLAIGLKNAGEVLANLTSVVHFSVNEQCVEYKECESFAPMVEAGKPVFHIEYPHGAPGDISGKTATHSCSRSGDGRGSDGFSSLLKGIKLDGWVEFCDRSTANTTMIQADS